jgi:RND superfamily putative drug exporter
MRSMKCAEPGSSSGCELVLELPDGSSVRRSNGWAALSRLADSLAADERIAMVHLCRRVARAAGMGRSALVFLPTETVSGLVSEDGRLALLDVLPREELSPSEVVTLVRELRAHGASFSGIPGSRLLAGGLPAFNADYQEVLGGRLARSWLW